jgi:hypothetical protein
MVKINTIYWTGREVVHKAPEINAASKRLAVHFCSMNYSFLRNCAQKAGILLIPAFTLFVASCEKDPEDCQDKISFYQDADGDGYGNAAMSVLRCVQPDGYVPDASDCNDQDSTIHPGALEIDDDGIDQDCDGVDGKSWYLDFDQDGYGNPLKVLRTSTQPAGYVKNNRDCNDSSNLIHPGAIDIPNNGIDENCDGLDAKYWFADEDKDGYGNQFKKQTGNTAPLGFVADSSDCNDTNASVHPGATEITGNDIDEDCDGADAVRHFQDKDDDGFGNPDVWLEADVLIPGYSTIPFDCNDNDPKVNPAADELCDGIDNNCDGLRDERFDLKTDNRNCGSCGIVCPSGYSCKNGVCIKD